MRIVEWNCCEGFGAKESLVTELGCDLAIYCEVPQLPAASLLGARGGWEWAGALAHKGVAIASYGGTLTPWPVEGPSSEYSVGALTDEGIGVLAIWAGNSRGASYATETSVAVAAHAELLTAHPGLVAGDLNLLSPDMADGRRGGTRRVLDLLTELGYVSLYHHHSGEAFGAESRPTYFHRRKAAEPFHIDYCLLHRSLLSTVRSVAVGEQAEWLVAGRSDHMPMIIDLDLTGSGRPPIRTTEGSPTDAKS